MSGNKQRFLICNNCGNFVGFFADKGNPLTCCGKEMVELEPNTVDASNEKHLPSLTVSGEKLDVQIGSVSHPMEDAHHITFIYVETEKGSQNKHLKIGDKPNSSFLLTDDKPIAVYAYCNLHGLWKTSV